MFVMGVSGVERTGGGRKNGDNFPSLTYRNPFLNTIILGIHTMENSHLTGMNNKKIEKSTTENND